MPLLLVPQGFEALLVPTDCRTRDREMEVIRMIVEGKDNKEISASMFIAEGTVKNTITTIISKLQLKDRTQLAVFAIRNHLI